MQRFFLHLHNGVGVIRDDEGQQFDDLGGERQAACESIRDILSNEVRDGVLDLRGRVEIADEAGAILAIVAYTDAVELRLEADSG